MGRGESLAHCFALRSWWEKVKPVVVLRVAGQLINRTAFPTQKSRSLWQNLAASRAKICYRPAKGLLEATRNCFCLAEKLDKAFFCGSCGLYMGK